LLSIFSWRVEDGFTVLAGERDGRLVLAARHAEDPGLDHLAMPLGGDPPTPAELAALCDAAGFDRCWYVPRAWCEHVGAAPLAAAFDLVEHPEWSEYVFDTADLAELKGARFSKKRNLIHQFERDLVEPGRVAVEALGAGNVDECAVFLEEWCAERDCEAAGERSLSCEKRAAARALGELGLIGGEGILVRVDGQVSGFGIAHAVSAGMGALHFEKAFARVKGLYQWLDRECARRLFAGRFALINKESDLGEPELAQAKRSYFPVAMVELVELVRR